MPTRLTWPLKVLERRLERSGDKKNESSEQTTLAKQGKYVPPPGDYPVFPPPAPKIILRAAGDYFARIAARRYGAPRGVFEDSPTYTLYRLYEFIVLDKVFDYRNALEAFWRQPQWVLRDIPDPKDDPNDDGDPERYAFLAGCTYLMVLSFNQRVRLGLQRGMRSLITPEEAEACRNVPDELRKYERVPRWAADAPPLKTMLAIPTHDGKVLTGKVDKRADPDFLKKNILLRTPYIYFT